MGSEWPTVPLGELVEMSADKIETKSIPEKCYVSTDSMLPDFGGVSFNRATPSVAKTSSFSKEDILFSNIRTYFRKLWIADRNGGCSNDVIVFRSKENVHPEFMFYSMMDERFIQHTVQTSKGTKMPRGDKSAIIQYRTILPPLPEQKAIAHILGTLDDKIELNRRMNATLEGMAQALFKSWFVDFDPVIDNALAAGNPIPDELAARAEVRRQALANGTTQQGSVDHPTLSDPKSLFPAAFEFNDELGWIPEGWRTESLEAHLDVLETGRRPKGGVSKYTSGVPSVGAESIFGVGQFNFGKLKFVPEEFFDNMKSGKVESYDVLLYKDGGKPGEFKPRAGMFGEGFPFESFGINEHVFRIRSKSLGQPFLYYQIRSERVFHHFAVRGGKAAIPGINQQEVKSVDFLIPTEEARQVFNHFVQPIFEKILKSANHSRMLERLRDTLLPKLISGELDLKSGASKGSNAKYKDLAYV